MKANDVQKTGEQKASRAAKKALESEIPVRRSERLKLKRERQKGRAQDAASAPVKKVKQGPTTIESFPTDVLAL
jgi:hypothetical protein